MAEYNLGVADPSGFASGQGTVTIGLAFTVSSGSNDWVYCKGIRFYKNASDPLNAHEIGLWVDLDMAGSIIIGGVLIHSETSSGEASGAGWVEYRFSTPQLLQPAIRYIIGVYCPDGHIAVQAVQGDYGAGKITAAATVPGFPLDNGRYDDGPGLQRTDDHFSTNGYCVDAIFEDAELVELATDSFTRADQNPIVAPWASITATDFVPGQLLNNFIASSQPAVLPAGSFYDGLDWMAAITPTNHMVYSECIASDVVSNANQVVLPAIWRKGDDGGYFASYNVVGTVNVYELFDSGFTLLNSATVNIVDGDVVRLEKYLLSNISVFLRLKVNDTYVLFASRTIGSNPDLRDAVHPGAYMFHNKSFDDWSGGVMRLPQDAVVGFSIPYFKV